MSTASDQLPRDVRVQRTLARWIWTLYRQHPGLKEFEIVQCTGADQAYVHRSIQTLLDVGLLRLSGTQRVTHNTMLTDTGNKPSGSATPSLKKSQQRVYQGRQHAQRRAAALSEKGQPPFKVFKVQAGHGATTAQAQGNRAATTSFVVAQSSKDVPALIRQWAKYPALYDFNSQDRRNRATVTALP